MISYPLERSFRRVTCVRMDAGARITINPVDHD